MKLVALQALIAAGESQTLELKKSTAVKDSTLEELAQEFQGFEPPLQTHMQRIPVSETDATGLDVLLVQVDRATNSPVSFRGAPYERVLNTTRIMPCANYQRVLAEAMHATDRWEMQPVISAGESVAGFGVQSILMPDTAGCHEH